MSEAANNFALSAKNGWAELVRVTGAMRMLRVRPDELEKSALTMADSAGVGAAGVLEKMKAIRFALELGRTEDFVIRLGQSRTISAFREARASKRKRKYPFVNMSFRLTPNLRHHVQQEIARIRKVLGIKPTDSETLWMFLHAEMSQWTAQQIRHSAGEARLKRYAEKTREADRTLDRATEEK